MGRGVEKDAGRAARGGKGGGRGLGGNGETDGEQEGPVGERLIMKRGRTKVYITVRRDRKEKNSNDDEGE